MLRIYTKSGDKGTTSIIYGQRVPKNDLRVEAYGTCDEANSIIGLALSHLDHIVDWNGMDEFKETMERVQTLLFHAGAELATPRDKKVVWKLNQEHIEELEEHIDRWQKDLPELKNFILPSGHTAAAALHTARTVVRRAERLAVSLQEELGNSRVIIYLNRLSDFLFVAARYVNLQCGGKEVLLQTDS